MHNKHVGSDGSESDSLSTGAVAAVTCIVTLIVSVTVTAVITFIITYVVCVKRKCIFNPEHQSTQEKVLYEQVGSPSSTITRNNLRLQPIPTCETSHTVTMDTNPAYQTRHEVTMDTNPAYN